MLVYIAKYSLQNNGLYDQQQTKWLLETTLLSYDGIYESQRSINAHSTRTWLLDVETNTR